MVNPLDRPPAWMAAELRSRTGRPLHECVRMLSAATVDEYRQVAGDGGARYHRDPAEDDPAMAATLLRATLEAEAELAAEDRTEMGYCHLFWRTKKRILSDRYGIAWRTPAEMNPLLVFD